MSSEYLLAVDVGLHTGLALFDDQTQLIWYRSQHFASPSKLKKVIGSLLREPPRPGHLYLEGGGPLVELWQSEAAKLGVQVVKLHAEQWRRELFYARQHSSGAKAKKEADGLARQVIEQFGGKRPTSLRHDAAEAILIGLYGLLQLGWLKDWPLKTQGEARNDRA